MQGHTPVSRIMGADACALTDSIMKHVGLAGGSGSGATATLPLSQTNRASATGMTLEMLRSSSGTCIGS